MEGDCRLSCAAQRIHEGKRPQVLLHNDTLLKVPSPSLRSVPLGPGLVHLYTAMGSVLGFLMVLAAITGATVTALWLALIALIVDGTDGMMARAMKVSDRMPWFDGARLDDIVDYLTYVFAPVVLLYVTGFIPSGVAGLAVASLPLLASSYQFCRVDAKTEDHCFMGFPSYWNVVAFYAIVMDLSVTAVTVLLVLCSLLVFVPLRYLYPSRTRTLRTTNLTLTAGWLVTYAVILWQMPNPHPAWLAASLLYIVYYAGVSGYLSWKARQKPAV